MVSLSLSGLRRKNPKYYTRPRRRNRGSSCRGCGAFFCHYKAALQMCRILSPAGGFFFASGGQLSANGSRKLSLSETKEERTALHLPPSGQASSPHTSNFYKFFIFLRPLSKFLDRKCWRPDAKSNILTKMQLIAFYRPPKSPKNPPFLRLARHLLLLLWADGPRTAEFMFHSSSEERTTIWSFHLPYWPSFPLCWPSSWRSSPPPGRVVSVHCRVRRRRDAVRR